jgi:hypothetical protein
MNRAQTLEWERRWALRAALCAFAAAGLFIAATLVVGGSNEGANSTAQALRDFHENRDTLLLAAILKTVAMTAFAVPLYYLFRAAAARSPAVRRGFVGIVIAGPLFVAVLDLLLWLVIDPAARDFATPGGGAGVAVGEYAEDLIEDQGLLGVYTGVQLAGPLGLAFGVIYTTLWAMRTGLVTRFLGTFGMALGAIQILYAPLLLLLVFWVAWLGAIFIDRLPRDRPRAWDSGEAEPWPKPGEAPAKPRDEEAEGAVTELAAPAENPHAGRRERAKRRKRKRRS